jgi:hypothetical protein
MPVPAVTNVPESTASSGRLATGSASPVSSDSSTSSPSVHRTVPSTTTRSPGATTSTSSTTTCLGSSSTVPPSRRTLAGESPSRLSASSVRLARTMSAALRLDGWA